MAINFAKLNHILLPDTKAGRDRFRRGLWGKVLAPVSWLYGALSDEGRVLAVASLLVAFFGLDVQASDVFLLWSAIAGLFAGSLAVRRLFRMPGAAVRVSCARRVTVGEDMRFAVTVRNDGPRDAFAVRIRGPFLPWDGTTWNSGASSTVIRRQGRPWESGHYRHRPFVP